MTPEELALELRERGVPPLVVCEAGALMLVESDPDALAKAMAGLSLGMMQPPQEAPGA